MKQVIENRYFKVFKFLSSKEVSDFLNNQGGSNILSLDEEFGNNYFCYICYHSLTHEKQFIISFNSDEIEDNLSLLFWHEHKMLVLDTGKNVYLIDNNLNILSSFGITTPLIGLYLVDKNNLLILEEAFLQVVNYKGEILRSELFDLIENFNIDGNKLVIQTGAGKQTFQLC